MLTEQQVEQRVAEYLPLAKKIAGERTRPGCDHAAIFSAAMEGLWYACRTYDGRGTLAARIGTLCNMRIITALRGTRPSCVSLDHVEDEDGLSVAERIPAEVAGPWPLAEIAEAVDAVVQTALNPTERVIIHEHYVLRCSLKDIAARYRVSPVTIGFNHQRALRRLREECARRQLRLN